MTDFTPISSLAGGMLIGLSAVLLMAATGRIAGISGIVGRLLPPYDGSEVRPAAAFVIGLVFAPLLIRATGVWPLAQTVSTNLPLLAVAGALVGFGAAYGAGCTSGHGVCGISRLSARSLVATATFMTTAVATVFVVRHVIGKM